MNLDLLPMQLALSAMTEAELHAFIVASNEAPPIAYGLLVWIEGACDWELNRRTGHDYELLPPEAAIDPSEDAASIDAVYALQATFSDTTPAVRAFFDTLKDLLTGRGLRH